ncbi:MAG: hypothetical protein KGL39_39480 [Patescibacteria group bacterium]|nr:hypothetical protein [Patescibacteria group bacterium]
MLGRLAPFEVFRQNALNLSNVTRFTTQWPVSKPYHYIDLLFELKVTGGAAAATGPVADGLLAWIKSINFFTPKNEYIFQNVPGRFAYVIGAESGFDFGAPRLDVVPNDPGNGSTSSVFGVLIRIPLNDYQAFDGSDFILDSMGYSNLNFDVTVGSVSDLYGTPNNVSISSALLTAVAWQEPVPLVYQTPTASGGAAAQSKKAGQVAKWYQQFFVAGFGDPTSVGFIDLVRSADIAYNNLWFFHGQSASAGQAFSGATDNIGTRYTDLTLITDNNIEIKNILTSLLRDQWQARYAGFNANFKQNSYLGLAFPARGQKQAALYSGDKSQMRVSWTLPGSGAASSGSMLSIGAKVWRRKAAV